MKVTVVWYVTRCGLACRCCLHRTPIDSLRATVPVFPLRISVPLLPGSAYISTVKIDTMRSTETSVKICQNIRRHFPRDLSHPSRRKENLKFKFFMSLAVRALQILLAVMEQIEFQRLFDTLLQSSSHLIEHAQTRQCCQFLHRTSVLLLGRPGTYIRRPAVPQVPWYCGTRRSGSSVLPKLIRVSTMQNGSRLCTWTFENYHSQGSNTSH
jgi:hypothetical protein